MKTIRIKQEGFAIVEILLIFAVMALVVGAGWYVWQSRNKIDKTLNNTGNSFPTVAVKKQNAQDYLSKLSTYCTNYMDAYSELTESVYASNDNGNYVICSFKNTSHANNPWWRVATMSEDGTWNEVWQGGNEKNMNLAKCAQYKIPKSIYEECSGIY